MIFNEKHKEKIHQLNNNLIYLYTYDKNDILHNHKKTSNYYIRLKCKYCGEEQNRSYYSIKPNSNCNKCCNSYENSFAYYIQMELKESLDKYWDWDKNIINPYHVSKSSNKKVWIKCIKKDYHGSYEISCANFKVGYRCSYCSKNNLVHPKDSFAQYHINNTDKNFIEKYWSNKNIIDPWEISPNSKTKIYIKCQNNKEHEYQTKATYFTIGHRCPYCNNRKVHIKNSFGYLYPEKAKYWSDKNKLSPYEIPPFTNKKYWFKCENCGDDYLRSPNHISSEKASLRCLNCTSSRGELKIFECLKKIGIESSEIINQKTFKGLIGLGNGLLSYDFYLPKYNLLIEFQGKQHEQVCRGVHSTKEDFEKQVEHDKRKFNYAIENNIDIIYIYYWQYDEIEDILKYELNN